MRKVIFVDLNNSLVEKVKLLGIESYNYNYFIQALHTERPVLMTASNPYWSFGGGIDAMFAQQFPELVKYKQVKQGGNERIMNICFVVTVDEHLKATKESVKSAIQFALDNTEEGETLLLSGVGTGIGGLSQESFVGVLREVLKI